MLRTWDAETQRVAASCPQDQVRNTGPECGGLEIPFRDGGTRRSGACLRGRGCPEKAAGDHNG